MPPPSVIETVVWEVVVGQRKVVAIYVVFCPINYYWSVLVGRSGQSKIGIFISKSIVISPILAPKPKRLW